MNDTFFISDTHFGHSNIIKYSNRPFQDIEEMNEKMVRAWNETVKQNDIVYHLGDVAFMGYGKFCKLLDRLNGHLNIIFGNHDKMIRSNRNDLLSFHNVSSIQDYKELYVGDQMFVLFHYGQRVWNKSHHGSIHLYGHSHGSLPPFGKSVDVGVDCKEITTNYRPVSVDEVLKYMKNRQGETVDHHMMEE